MPEPASTRVGLERAVHAELQISPMATLAAAG